MGGERPATGWEEKTHRNKKGETGLPEGAMGEVSSKSSRNIQPPHRKLGWYPGVSNTF